MDAITAIGIAVLAVYVLAKDVIRPLVKQVLGKKDDDNVHRCPIRLDGRVSVMEINLTKLETRIVDFGRLQEEYSTAVDNKLDMVLAELKELRDHFDGRITKLADRVDERLTTLGERMATAETDVKHLLQRRAKN